MKPIFLIAIIGVAAAAVGIGSLSNTITLTVQDLGVGEATLSSPIDNAALDFGISKVKGQFGFKNIITYCVLTNTDNNDVIVAKSLVFCKLTDIDGNVAAEGTKLLTTELGISESTRILINDPGYLNTDVRNIHDVILVVQGPKVP